MAGYDFESVAADVPETPQNGEKAETYTLRVAGDKVAHVARLHGGHDVVVLGADTEVVAGGRILGKPVDQDDAARMLRLLSGTVHTVLTAVVIDAGGRRVDDVVVTRVRFSVMTPAEIAWYVSSGEPIGKAGAYGIQGRAARFIDWIEGSWSNVVGLPLAAVHRLLSAVQ
jgi:septum formation protein